MAGWRAATSVLPPPAVVVTPARFAIAGAGALPVAGVVEQVHATHAGLRRERHEGRVGFGHLAAAQAVFLLGQGDHGPAFGCFVGQRSQLRGLGQFLHSSLRARE